MTTPRVPPWAVLSLCVFSSNAACVSAGKEFDTTHVNDIRKGQAREEIVRWFGEPSRGDKLSLVDSPRGCVKRYRYKFADSDESRVLWIDFDWRDQVCDAIYEHR